MKPYPKTKPSGVEWLGDAPEHWEMKRVKYVTRIVNGSTPNRGISAYLDEETAKVDTTIERVQEYGSALITAAVTGKIDVRKQVET